FTSMMLRRFHGATPSRSHFRRFHGGSLETICWKRAKLQASPDRLSALRFAPGWAHEIVTGTDGTYHERCGFFSAAEPDTKKRCALLVFKVLGPITPRYGRLPKSCHVLLVVTSR